MEYASPWTCAVVAGAVYRSWGESIKTCRLRSQSFDAQLSYPAVFTALTYSDNKRYVQPPQFLLSNETKQPSHQKPPTMPPMQYFPKAQSTFVPPLVANENAYLGDIASSYVESHSIPCLLFHVTFSTPMTPRNPSTPNKHALPNPTQKLPYRTPLLRFLPPRSRHPLGLHILVRRDEDRARGPLLRQGRDGQ
jgi:hypothetical protein